MSNPTGKLYIKNSFQNGSILKCGILEDGWNCCDAPLRKQEFEVGFGQTFTLEYLKKSGHGCDGKQGTFILGTATDRHLVTTVWFSFDSDANLGVERVNNGPYASCQFSGNTLEVFYKALDPLAPEATHPWGF